MIIDQQHGFSNGKSIQTNLLISRTINLARYSCIQLDSIYTDFKQVSHKLVIQNLVDL